MVMESEFLRLLRTASKDDLKVLAKLLSPYLRENSLIEPLVWGDRSRIDISRITISINDLLLNTRSGNIRIDEDCFFGHRCMLLTGTHDYRKAGMERLKAVPTEGRDIHIKRGVWIGSGSTILGPAVIGENAVVAAGSLVIGDVPGNTVYAGRPARLIKEIDFGTA